MRKVLAQDILAHIIVVALLCSYVFVSEPSRHERRIKDWVPQRRAILAEVLASLEGSG